MACRFTFQGKEYDQDGLVDALRKMPHELARKYIPSAVLPPMPMEKNWAELGLRNALIKAVQEGKDAISWTPGAEQAKRYSLSKHLNQLLYNPHTKELSGFTTGGRHHSWGTVEPEKLPDMIGKELAERLLNTPVTEYPKHMRRPREIVADLNKLSKEEFGGQGGITVHDFDRLKNGDLYSNLYETNPRFKKLLDEWEAADRETKAIERSAGKHELTGENLQVGGQGMTAFYDKMLVNKMNDIGKKFGAKVEWKEIPSAASDKGMSGEEAMRALTEHQQNLIRNFPVGEPERRPGWWRNSTAEERNRVFAYARENLLEDSIKVPVFKITPELREHVIKKGMPLFSESGAEGKLASQVGQASRAESEYGKGWFYNPKNNSLHAIDTGDLGPHGDHDGWISIGENAKKLGVGERQAGAFQTATWGPNLETKNPYIKKLLEELPAEAKKDDGALYDWFEENRYSKTFEKLFEKVFGVGSGAAAGAIPPLVRVRRWPGKKGEGDYLAITDVSNIGSPRKFVEAFMKDNPNALDGIRKIGIESDDRWGHFEITPEQFLSGRWKNKDAQFRADSGGEGKIASQAAQASREPINLGQVHEERKLQGFHKELGEDIRKSAQERAEIGQQYHEEGKLPFPTGTRFSTNHSRANDRPPWEVTGYYVDRKNPDKYGYHVQRGKKGEDGYERSILYANDSKNPRIAKLAEGFKPFGKPMRVLGESGGEGKLASQAAQSQKNKVPGPVSQEDDRDAPAAQKRAAGGRVELANIDHNPSEAQKEAGNYSKDKVHRHGLLLTIENAKGKPRSGVGPDGKPWTVNMPAHYGYVNGSVGADKDHVDVYVGPHTKAPCVYVIDQRNAETGKFDEHKAFVGFASERQALATYMKGFSDGKGPDRFSAMKRMTVPEFKKWVFSPKSMKPVAS